MYAYIHNMILLSTIYLVSIKSVGENHNMYICAIQPNISITPAHLHYQH